MHPTIGFFWASWTVPVIVPTTTRRAGGGSGEVAGDPRPTDAGGSRVPPGEPELILLGMTLPCAWDGGGVSSGIQYSLNATGPMHRSRRRESGDRLLRKRCSTHPITP